MSKLKNRIYMIGCNEDMPNVWSRMFLGNLLLSLSKQLKEVRNRDVPGGGDISSWAFTADTASHFTASHLAPVAMLLPVTFRNDLSVMALPSWRSRYKVLSQHQCWELRVERQITGSSSISRGLHCACHVESAIVWFVK